MATAGRRGRGRQLRAAVTAGWSRMGGQDRAALAVVTGTLVIIGVAAVATGLHHPRTEPAGPLAGRPIPPAQFEAIQTAAGSCTALTGPRLAGQVMATSGFRTDAVTPEGSGIAGLTDAAWRDWAPTTDAQRTDPVANILALAHDMCDLIGRARAARLPLDPWQAALAGFHTSFTAVVATHGIPPQTAAYVDAAARYADWYGQQPQFAQRGVGPLPSVSGPGGPTGPVTGTPTPAGRPPASHSQAPITVHPATTPPPAHHPAGPTRGSAPPTSSTVSGHISCLSGSALTGVWVEAQEGGSGWSPWWPDADPAGGTFAFTITTGPWQVHVGCGGSQDSWAVATYSNWVTTTTASFTCDDLAGQSRYGQCWT